MNLRSIVLPVLAVAGLVATVAAVKKMEFRTLDVPVPVSPAPSPFESRIAATGLVEPLGGVTYVDAADAGVVGRVAVAEGDSVKAGDVLWELDHARTKAELGLAEAERAVAMAQLVDEQARLKALMESGAAEVVPQVERVAREQSAKVAAARVQRADAQVEAAQAQLHRETVRSPIDGTVLFVDVRPGEYAPPGGRRMAIGSIDPMQVRVDIDEVEFARFAQGGKAQASLRGVPGSSLPLRFLRVVPLVQPKRTLTGEAAERIDTRVVQVIYELGQGTHRVQPGQVVDVYIEVPDTAQ
ncbi:MAG: efflux RND transporter periplasmic adaptor subunit [Planctomycetes bacterium]|nr:efflux RND transporter periplasmic adaptor subunit [Planctomycetota bacterium]